MKRAAGEIVGGREGKEEEGEGEGGEGDAR